MEFVLEKYKTIHLEEGKLQKGGFSLENQPWK